MVEEFNRSVVEGVKVSFKKLYFQDGGVITQAIQEQLDKQSLLLQKQLELLEKLVNVFSGTSRTITEWKKSSVSDSKLSRFFEDIKDNNENLSEELKNYQRIVDAKLKGLDSLLMEWVAHQESVDKNTRQVIAEGLKNYGNFSQSLISRLYESNTELFEKFLRDFIQQSVLNGKETHQVLFEVYNKLATELGDRKEVERKLLDFIQKYEYGRRTEEKFKIKVREQRREEGEYANLKELLQDIYKEQKQVVRESVEQKRGTLLGSVLGMVDPRLGMVAEGAGDLINIVRGGGVGFSRGGVRGVGGRGVGRRGFISRVGSRLGLPTSTGTITGSPLGFVGGGLGGGISLGKGGGIGGYGGGAIRALGGVGKLVKGAPVLGAVLGVGLGLLSGQGVAEAAGGGIGGVVGAALGSVLGPVGTVIGGIVGSFVGEWVARNFDSIKKKTVKLFEGVWKSIKGVGMAFVNVFNKVKDFLGGLVKQIVDFWVDVSKWVWSKIPQPVREVAEGVYQTGKEAVSRTYETGKEVLRYVGENLGFVARKAEAASTDIYKGAGVVSTGRGDAGGVSYGTYQLSSSRGTLQDFLKKSGYAKEFAGLDVNSPEFKQKWKELSKSKEFAEAQHRYITETHYLPAVNMLKKYGIDVSRSRALQEMAFSRGVQQRGYFEGVLKNAFRGMSKEEISRLSEEEIIKRVYSELRTNVDKYFQSSSKEVRESLRSGRFVKEEKELLSLVKAEKEGRLKTEPIKVDKVDVVGREGVGTVEVLGKSNVIREGAVYDKSEIGQVGGGKEKSGDGFSVTMVNNVGYGGGMQDVELRLLSAMLIE